MTRKNLYRQFISILMLFSFLACEQENDQDQDNDNGSDQTNTELLTNHSWYTNSIILEPGVQVGEFLIINIYSIVSDCTTDDFFTFSSNGTTVIDQGTELCDSMIPQTASYNWVFIENETKIVFHETLSYILYGIDTIFLDTVQIVELTTDLFKINFPYTEPFNQTQQQVSLHFIP